MFDLKRIKILFISAINLFVYHLGFPFVLNLLLLPNQIIKSTYITATCEFCTLSSRQFLSGLLVFCVLCFRLFSFLFFFCFFTIMSLTSGPRTERGLDSMSTEHRNEHEMRKSKQRKATAHALRATGEQFEQHLLLSLSRFTSFDIPLRLPFGYSQSSLCRTHSKGRRKNPG